MKVKKYLLKSALKKFTKGGFKVVYWDGEEENYGDEEPKVKILFNRPLPADLNLDDPVLALGEAYMDEIIEFEGNLEEITRVVDLNKEVLAAGGLQGILMNAVKTLSSVAAKAKEKANIQHHYDLGNDFFSLWLDETMSYSCGYFKNPDDSLYQAQLQKVNHILRKMQLKPGERLLDIGSGWGWLIISAAQQYGVKATGITLSEEQYCGTKERIKQLGMEEAVTVKLQSYQELDQEEHRFDKIASVGMFEHVGRENLDKYMQKVHDLLEPGGISMLHTIMGKKEKPINSWLDKYIFPGGYIPSLRETIWLFPEYDFHLLHAESLRWHYALTLERWHKNFTQHQALVEERYGRRFVRMWDLYLRSSAASFRASGLNIYQLLFSKGLNNNLKLTLDHVYNPDGYLEDGYLEDGYLEKEAVRKAGSA
jgi:cyclopropane-fatty-acyl-phospholipid synthase